MSVVKKSIDKKLSEEKFKIYRWDAVMTAKNDLPAPMVYIKPTLKFLEFIENNNYRILLSISGTNTIYDGKTMWGIVDKSSNTPNCRPNFYKQTGYYVVTLESFWYGYPNVGNEGERIINTPQVYPEVPYFETNPDSSNKLSSMYDQMNILDISSKVILSLIGVFLLYFCLTLYRSKTG